LPSFTTLDYAPATFLSPVTADDEARLTSQTSPPTASAHDTRRLAMLVSVALIAGLVGLWVGWWLGGRRHHNHDDHWRMW